MSNNKNKPLKFSPLFKIMLENFIAFLLSTFCFAYYLSQSGFSQPIIASGFAIGYLFVLSLIMLRFARKLPLAAVMLLIPIIPLAALLTVLTLLPLLQALRNTTT